MPRQKAKRWPPTDPPARVNVAAELRRMRHYLHDTLAYAEQVLGVKIGAIAQLARMSEKGLLSYRSPSWNPIPSTMIVLDEVAASNMQQWLEAAQARRAKENGA